MPVNHFKDRVGKLLSQGVRDLSMTLGVLARIDNDNYEIVAVESNSGAYVAGEKYTLGDTFCREVFEKQRPIAETTIDNSPLALHHPLYRSLPLESYIGVPVIVGGKAWGTLDFSSMAQREESFSETDVRLVESLAEEIGHLLDDTENVRTPRYSA